MGSNAAKREIMEELGEDTEDISCIGMLENIYMYEGEPGHEIVLVFDGKFNNKELYKKERIKTLEGPKSGYAIWKNLNDFVHKGHTLYPDGLKALLQKHFI